MRYQCWVRDLNGLEIVREEVDLPDDETFDKTHWDWFASRFPFANDLKLEIGADLIEETEPIQEKETPNGEDTNESSDSRE